ncbi:MAG TPA: pyridoxamine 5'-phosphate oxidase family protein, partial [Candidatus Acidoferrales bacterium]|nr:pyridoxamine 5'-phosphate oxidase family protein [Candidatus Acidoferrales bacterium]
HVPGYGIPKNIKGVLPWSFVQERVSKAQNYWICTSSRDARPHAVPTWGVWVDGAVCFGGSPETRWARNLAANPAVAVHLESGSEVVILEGTVERVTDAKDPLATRVADAYEAKYKMRHPPPFWVLRPSVVFAWSKFPKDATRWKLI